MDYADADDDTDDQWSDEEHEWGEPVDPECRAVLEAFALALTERRASDAVAHMLRDVVDRGGGEVVYAQRLDRALDDAGPLSFRGVISSPHNDNLWWGQLLVAGPDPDEAADRRSGKTIDLMMRRDETWWVDADVLDPDHMPRIDEAEIDYRRLMGFGSYESLEFVPFGLADWDGPIAVGGSSGEGDREIRITALSLVHGEVYERYSSSVIVETSIEPADLDNALHHLASIMQPLPPDATRAGMRERQKHEEAITDRLRRQPRETTIGVVDGAEQEFVIIRAEDGAFAASAQVGDRFVTIIAASTTVPELRLVSVEDLDPYFEGTVASMKRMHEKAIVEHADFEHDDDDDDDGGRSRPVSIVMIANADSEVEEGVIDFCLDLTNRLARLAPREIADRTSSTVTKGDVDAYADRLENALKTRPIIHVAWADQPRAAGADTYAAVVELLFEGDNPLTRWYTFEFDVDDGSPKLRTDLAQLAQPR